MYMLKDELKELNLQIFSKKNIEFLSLLDPPMDLQIPVLVWAKYFSCSKFFFWRNGISQLMIYSMGQRQL